MRRLGRLLLVAGCVALFGNGALAWLDDSLPPTAEEQFLSQVQPTDAELDRLEAEQMLVLSAEASRQAYDCSFAGGTLLPSYITADAMLYLWYDAYLQAFAAAQEQHLKPALQLTCTGLLTATQRLRAAEDEPAIQQNEALLRKACSLLESDDTGVAAPVPQTPAPPAATGDLARGYRGAVAYLQQCVLASGDDGQLRRALLLSLALKSDRRLAESYAHLSEMLRYLYGPREAMGLDELAARADDVWGPDWTRESLADLGRLRAALGDGGKSVAALPAALAPEQYAFSQAPASGGGLELTAAVPRGAPSPQLAQYAPLQSAWIETLQRLQDEPAGLPAFARTRAYSARMLNCSVVGWVQLRHAPTGDAVRVESCHSAGAKSGIVEPLPGFFTAYARMCSDLRGRLTQWEIDGPAVRVVAQLQNDAEALARCAEDQLAGRDISWAADVTWRCARRIARLCESTPLAVAGPATDMRAGQVSHPAAGPLRCVLVRYEDRDTPRLAVGWVGSAYEVGRPGALNAGEFRDCLQRRFSGPRTPEFLAPLFGPPATDGAQQRVALARIEELLADGESEQAGAVATGFIAQERATRWAPEAILLLGEDLHRREQYAAAMEMLQQARPLYGCDARTEALKLRSRCEHSLRLQKGAAAREEELAQALAATAPRTGLDEAAEVARQDRRALVLLGHADYMRGNTAARRRLLAQLIEQCPLSGHVPYARLSLAVARRTEDVRPGLRPASSEASLAEVRHELLRVAEDYEGSIIGFVARLEATRILSVMGLHEEAFLRITKLAQVPLPDRDPYPLSAESLDRSGLAGHGTVSVRLRIHDVAYAVARPVFLAACAQPDLELARSARELLTPWVSMADVHGLGLVWPYFDRLNTDTAGLTALLPVLPLCLAGREDLTADADPYPPSVLRAALQRAEPLAEPGGPALLFCIWQQATSPRWPSQSQIAEQAYSRLTERFPDSLEALVASCHQKAEAGQIHAARALLPRIEALVPHGREGEKTDGYRRMVLRACPFIAPLGADGLPPEAPEWEQRYGAFMTEAKVTAADLRNCDTEWRLVRLLMARLPAAAAEVVLATEDPRDYAHEAQEALARSPKSPAAHEIRFRLGDLRSLAEILAAGPQTPHFSAAADAFCSRTVETQVGLAEATSGHRYLARLFKGTPAETLALAEIVRLHVQFEQPEEALSLAEAALTATPADHPLRDRLEIAAQRAREAVAMKAAAGTGPTWTVSLPDHTWSFRRLAGGEEGPLVAQGDGPDMRCLFAMDPQTGEQLWTMHCRAPISLLPIGRQVLFSTAYGTVTALNAADGEELWSRAIGLSQEGCVWLRGGTDVLYALWQGGEVCRLDPVTGEVLWRKDMPLPSDAGRSDADRAPAAAAPGLLLVWDWAMQLHALNAESGAEVWSLWAESLFPGFTMRAAYGPHAPPIAVCGTIAILRDEGDEGECAAVVVDLATGQTKWRQPLPRGAYVKTGAEALYVCTGGAIARHRLDDGAVMWSVPLPGEVRGSICVGGTSIAAVVGTDIVVVDAGAGRIVARQPVGEGGVTDVAVAPTEAGVRVFVAGGREIGAHGIALPRRSESGRSLRPLGVKSDSAAVLSPGRTPAGARVAGP